LRDAGRFVVRGKYERKLADVIHDSASKSEPP
jgi:hypothetical protein